MKQINRMIQTNNTSRDINTRKDINTNREIIDLKLKFKKLLSTNAVKATSSMIGIIILVALTSCQKNRDKDQTPDPVAITPQKYETDSEKCNRLRNHYAGINNQIKARELRPQSFNIDRLTQRVVRKDCSGQVISDQEESTQSPRSIIRLSLRDINGRGLIRGHSHNSSNLLNYKYKGVTIFNAETCDLTSAAQPLEDVPSLGMIYSVTGNGRGDLQIKSDVVPGTYTYQMVNGLNNLYIYLNHDCFAQPLDARLRYGKSKCESSKETSVYKVPIQIHYAETRLADTLVLEPTKEYCAKQNTAIAK